MSEQLLSRARVLTPDRIVTVLDGLRTSAYQAREHDGCWYAEGPNVLEPCRNRREAQRWCHALNLARLTGALYLADGLNNGWVALPNGRAYR